VVEIPIDEVDGVLARTFDRRLEEALARGPRFVILDMDTWGGELHAAYDIADKVVKVTDDVVMVAYVSEKAISAGAMIALACDVIAMRPGTRLGDCEAITVKDGEILTAPEKIKTTLRQTFRDYAQRNGYPKDLAIGMVDKEHTVLKLWLTPKDGDFDLTTDAGFDAALAAAEIDYVQESALAEWLPKEVDRVLKKETLLKQGELLTMGAEEAHEYGFSRHTVKNRDELLRALGAPADATIDRLEETGWEKVVGFLASGTLRSLFMFVGMLGLMIEFYHPGGILPGAIGVVCLLLAFFAAHLLGLVGVLDVGLIGIGVLLIFAEVFLIPGFGVAGVLGGVALLLGFFLSMQSFTLPTTTWEAEAFNFNLTAFLLGFAGTAAAFAVAVRFLPSSPMLSRLVLTGQQRKEDGYSVGSPARVALLGREGIAYTALRPAGKIEVDGDRIDAVAEGTFIDKGQAVTILETAGNRVVVKLSGGEANA
jgi:membrane-bound serine protease (ClpP class)